MKKIVLAALVLAGAFFLAPPAQAQFTQVTATVTDPNGIPYANGTVSAVLTPGSASGFTLSGNPYGGRVGPASTDSTGSFTLNFGSNALITPSGTKWAITVNSNPGGIASPLGTGAQSFTVTMTISGATQNISAALNAAAPALTNLITVAGVSSATGTSPIVVSPTTGAVVISCPTCNVGTGSITACTVTGGVLYENGTTDTATCGADLVFTEPTGTSEITIGPGSHKITLGLINQSTTNDLYLENTNGTMEFGSAAIQIEPSSTSNPVQLFWGLNTEQVQILPGLIDFFGTTSGSGAIGVAPVAGTPCEIYLPTLSPSAGTFLNSAAPSGSTCQSSWDTLLVDNGTTLSYSGAGGIDSVSDGVHAGIMSVIGNTTAPSVPANSFGFIGPNSASFTSYVFQPNSTAPTTGQCFVIGTVSGSIVPLNYNTCPAGTVTSVVIAGTANQITASGTCTITTSGTCTLSLPNAVILGTDNSAAGTLQLANSAASAHTIWGSAATTSNTILGPAVVLPTNTIAKCVTSTTICTITPTLATDNGTTLTYTGTGGVSAPVLVSTVAIGTAPLTVTSTTEVANLNVNFLLGATWSAPAAIGNVTPNVVDVTSLGVRATHPLILNTAPTVASGFGSGPSIPNNNGPSAFTVNVGTGGSASSGVITLPAATVGWACMVAPNGAPQAAAVTYSAPTSTTSVTLTNYTLTTGVALAWTASTVLQVACFAY